MKCKTLLCLVVSSFALLASDWNDFSQLSGNNASAVYCTAMGYRALKNSKCKLVTAGGNFALREARNIDNSIAIGADTMSFSTNCFGVVAIGNGVGYGMVGATNVTLINGQIFVSQQADALWITPSKTNMPWASPVAYLGGTLYLNGQRVLVNGRELSGGGGGGYIPSIKCDMFVDGENGRDDWDGRSISTAKKTLDAAIAASAKGSTIGVMPATYRYPTYYNGVGNATNAVKFVALDTDATIIAGTNAATDRIVGNENCRPLFNGFTIMGMANIDTLAAHRDVFEYAVFEDCNLVVSNAVKYSCSIFGGCVFSNCTIKADIARSSIGGGESGVDGNFFSLLCDYVGCKVDIKSYGTGYAPSVVFDRFENTFFRIDKPRGFGLDPRQAAASGKVCECVDSTLVTDETPYNFRTTIGNIYYTYRGSLLGIEQFPYSNFTTNSITTNGVSVISSMGIDCRAVNIPVWRLYGYGSSADRLLADAIKDYISK